MTSFIIDLHNKCAYIYYKTEVAHYDRNSGSHISGMVAQAYRTGGSLEHRLFKKDVSFSYFAKVPYNTDRTQLFFDFKKNENLPYRINALIGKNGVGKTQILSHLAESLSGLTGSVSEKEESFKGKRPPVDKVISISYSAFDEFRKRVAEGNDYKDNSYAYCGIQSEHGTLTCLKWKRIN